MVDRGDIRLGVDVALLDGPRVEVRIDQRSARSRTRADVKRSFVGLRDARVLALVEGHNKRVVADRFDLGEQRPVVREHRAIGLRKAPQPQQILELLAVVPHLGAVHRHVAWLQPRFRGPCEPGGRIRGPHCAAP